MNKIELRKSAVEGLRRWVASQPVDRAARDQALCSHLRSWLKRTSGTWAGFQPFQYEPQVEPVYADGLAIRWCFPRVEGDNLGFYSGTADAFVLSNWGVREPDPRRMVNVDPNEIGGFLVPGVLFNRAGQRLGRGRGFYDRVLATTASWRVGIAYQQQLLEESIPGESWDQNMDMVITENEIVSCTERARQKWNQ